MSYTQYNTIARRFVEEIFNARKTELAKNFVTPDIIYHGMGEEVRSLEEFKQWLAEDLSAFPDMKVTILDEFGEQNKIAIRWTLKATHEKDFADFPATHKKFETQGVDIFYFEGDKIKEAWTICDMSVLTH
ncbi:MAG TPA: ester cyclase [Nitrososphaeraceae archaeon]|nr:ester cyclase [Nitrososphaeraceae archaeon]